MKQDILRWIQKVCKANGLEAIYIPDNDVYSLRFKGRGVHNFNSKNFYELPQRHRETHVMRLLKVGLHHNAGEKTLQNQIYINRRLGKKIYG